MLQLSTTSSSSSLCYTHNWYFLLLSILGLIRFCYYGDESNRPPELAEEFDTFPKSMATDIVRMRCDRMRAAVGRSQKFAGDFVSQGERLLSLLSGKDPRATGLLVTLCLVAAIFLLVTPFRLVVVVTVFYFMRHPCLRRQDRSSIALNISRRLPSKNDSIF